MFLVDTKYKYTDTVTNHQTFINSRFVWKQGAEGGRRRMMRRWSEEEVEEGEEGMGGYDF